MKIKVTSMQPFMNKGARMYAAWNLVRLGTEDGLEGIGAGFAYGGWGNIAPPRRINGYIQQMGQACMDAGAVSLSEFYSQVVAPGATADKGREWYCAAAAIELAMWDICGKLAKKPLYVLLGKQLRDTIPVYANHGVFFTSDTSNPFDANRILQMKQAGYALYKWDPFNKGGDPGQTEIDACVGQITKARELVGSDYPLGIDAHSRFNVVGGTMAAKAMEAMNVVFFENPVSYDDVDGFKSVAVATTIPLATGEDFYTLPQFQRFIDSGAVKILQPDVGVCGVLTAVQAARFADARGIQMYPHVWCGPIVARATAHMASVWPNVGFMEYAACSPDVSWENDLLSPPNTVVNGHLVVPSGHGLGITLNETLVQQRLVK